MTTVLTDKGQAILGDIKTDLLMLNFCGRGMIAAPHRACEGLKLRDIHIGQLFTHLGEIEDCDYEKGTLPIDADITLLN